MKLINKVSAGLLLFFSVFFLFAPLTYAAQIRADHDVTVGANEHPQDLYLFGGTLKVNAPVTNDLTVAGGDITINNPVTGGLLAAGGTITTHGSVGTTARVAGGDITIDGPITRDLVIAGGDIHVTKNASIGGDLVFGGGTLVLDAPVKGNVTVNGGTVKINNTVGGSVFGNNVGKLTLGSDAQIAGNLTYTSPEKATFENGAVVSGKQTFTQRKQNRHAQQAAKGFLATATIYKLVIDIILTLLFIYFFARLIMNALLRMQTQPVQSGAIGFAFLLLFPLAAFISLILLWLGIAAFFFYALAVIISLFLVKVFLGWIIVRWWQGRNKRDYVLDWKAGIVGPLVLALLAAIPVLGWLIAAILFFIALGAFIQALLPFVAAQRVERKSIKKRS